MDSTYSSALSVGEKVWLEITLRNLSQESIMVRAAGLIVVEGGSVYLSSLISIKCNN